MMDRVIAMVGKEFRQMFRDKRTMGLIFLVPLFLLIMFGYAISFEVNNAPLGIYDMSMSSESRRFIDSFFHSDNFIYKEKIGSYNRIDSLLDSGTVAAVLVIPRDFSGTLNSGKTAEVQVIIDGTNSTTAASVLGYVRAIFRAHSASLQPAEVQAALQYRNPIRPVPRFWYNPELKSAEYLVPGLITMIVLLTAVISTALAIVKEKERGTLEQLSITALRPLEVIAGKTVPYFAVTLVVTLLIILTSMLLFGVTVKGSFLDLLLVIVLFLLSSLGLGLLISALANNQQVAFIVAVFVTFLPSFILSGFVFPIRNMPPVIQAVTYAIPARYFLTALRNIMIKGTGIEMFWKEIVFLVGYSVVIIGASTAMLSHGRSLG